MDAVVYSERYYDNEYEYRHVYLPKNRRSYPQVLLKEREWREWGVEMSRGWIHYAVHRPEPHILLFKRPLHFEKLPKKEQDAHFARADSIVEKLNDELKKKRKKREEEKRRASAPKFLL